MKLTKWKRWRDVIHVRDPWRLDAKPKQVTGEICHFTNASFICSVVKVRRDILSAIRMIQLKVSALIIVDLLRRVSECLLRSSISHSLLYFF